MKYSNLLLCLLLMSGTAAARQRRYHKRFNAKPQVHVQATPPKKKPVLKAKKTVRPSSSEYRAHTSRNQSPKRAKIEPPRIAIRI